MGIKFFKKNRYDLTNVLPTTTVTDSVATETGEDFVNFMRNRNNTSGWMTTGSSDAGNTTIEIDFIDTVNIDSILLIGHNLKSFTLKYWNGSSWVDFSTPIAPTNVSKTSSLFEFTTATTQKLQLIILGTQTPNSEKVIKQFIATEIIGTFTEEPEVSPVFDQERRVTKYLSGKSFVSKSLGGLNLQIKKSAVASSADLEIVETLFDSYEGFLVYLSGGDDTQFEQQRKGYTLDDIFFMNCSNDLKSEYVQSRWKMGMPIDLKLVEVN
jgi:hypothetical protein